MSKTPKTAEQTTTDPPEAPTFAVKHNGTVEQMTYQQVFAAGYNLWAAHDYEQAGQVFSHLTGITTRGPKAHILWAHCCAMQGEYAECCRVLSEGLPEEAYGKASITLHEAFVMWRCGMLLDVRKGLEKVVAEHQELPSPCLILGAFLHEMGNTIRPPELLKQAIERDIPEGAVAEIAEKALPEAREARKAAKNTKPKP